MQLDLARVARTGTLKRKSGASMPSSRTRWLTTATCAIFLIGLACAAGCSEGGAYRSYGYQRYNTYGYGYGDQPYGGSSFGGFGGGSLDAGGDPMSVLFVLGGMLAFCAIGAAIDGLRRLFSSVL